MEIRTMARTIKTWVSRVKPGRVDDAMELFKEGASAGPEVNYNMGLVDIQNGNYTSAITNFGSENTFNVALAKVLNGDNEGAFAAVS